MSTRHRVALAVAAVAGLATMVATPAQAQPGGTPGTLSCSTTYVYTSSTGTTVKASYGSGYQVTWIGELEADNRWYVKVYASTSAIGWVDPNCVRIAG